MMRSLLTDRFTKHSASIGVIGLGYVGLPLGLAFAEKGFCVIGLDVDARFTAHATDKDTLNAYVAVYENDLTSQVRAGENSGATLHHDRVVRQWIGPVPLVAGSAMSGSANPARCRAAPSSCGAGISGGRKFGLCVPGASAIIASLF